MNLMGLIEIMIWFRVLFLMQFMVVKFKLQQMVVKKVILLTNNIFPTMVMFFLDFVIYLETVI